MDQAHQYFEVDVPQHLRQLSVATIVSAGEASCHPAIFAALVSPPSPHADKLRPSNEYAGSERSLRAASGASSPVASASASPTSQMFLPREWCSRRPPSIAFHDYTPLTLVRARYGVASASSSGLSTSADDADAATPSQLLVITHTLGCGNAGTHSDVSRLVPMFLIPRATILWHVSLISLLGSHSSLDGLCLLIHASHLLDAQLSTPHPEGWKKTRRLCLVVHDDRNDNPAVRSGSSCDGSEEDALESSSLLSGIPRDRRQLLRESLHSVRLVVLPKWCRDGVDHWTVAQRIVVADTLRSVSSTLPKRDDDEMSQAPLSCPPTQQRHASTVPREGAAILNVKKSIPVVNAQLLGRYFAECAIRCSNSAIGQLPIFQSSTETGLTSFSAECSSSSNGAKHLALRRLRSDFATRDALHELRQNILNCLTRDPEWTSLLTSSSSDEARDTPSNYDATEGGVAELRNNGATTQLRELCIAQRVMLEKEYFSDIGVRVDSAAVSEFRHQADMCIDSLLKDAARRSQEAKRAMLRSKLVERLEKAIPILENVLIHARFLSIRSDDEILAQ